MKLCCLVDDAARPDSSFRAEHGLSFLIETPEGQVLLDTGGSGEVLLHNMAAAGIEPEGIRALALSHSHNDHTGGLAALLARRPGLPVYAHPDIFRERFSQKDGKLKSIGLAMDPQALRQRADLRLHTGPQVILPGIWATGEILDRPEPQGCSPHHFVRRGDMLIPDPYQDDISLVLESPQGLVLLCGCCHAGLLNVLAHVRRAFDRDPVAIVGGTHLISADEAHLQRLVQVLQQQGPPALYPNHCTGKKALAALMDAFGKQVIPCPAGTEIEF